MSSQSAVTPSASPPAPFIIDLRWLAIESHPIDPPLSLMSPDWMGWVVQTPVDWEPLLRSINAFAWPFPFEPGAVAAGEFDRLNFPTVTPEGLHPPQLSFESGAPCGALSFALTARTRIPRPWSDAWHDDLWDALDARAEAFELLFKGLNPMRIGRLRAQGETYWSNRAESACGAWRSKMERDAIAQSLPSLDASRAPKSRPGL